MDHDFSDLQHSYDQVSQEYADRIFTELNHKPVDRELLDRFANHVRGRGTVCDIGCGPGQIARYLYDRGVTVVGVDLSQGMIEMARKLSPAIEFFQGNMLSLQVQDETWRGITAFYSIIHIPRHLVVAALKEFWRVLLPDGLLLISFHKGVQALHKDEWWGKTVSLDTFFFERCEMEDYLKSAGLEIEEVTERPPYAEFEFDSHRVYILARKPSSDSDSQS